MESFIEFILRSSSSSSYLFFTWLGFILKKGVKKEEWNKKHENILYKLPNMISTLRSI